MKVRLASISIHQTALMIAILYGIAGIVGALFIGVVMMAESSAHITPSTPNPPAYALILVPFVYFILGYISTAIGAWVYNLVAPSVGGVEFTLQNVGDQTFAPAVP